MKYACLELDISGTTYCIQRDVFTPSKDIDVYSCAYDELEDNFPKKYSSSLSKVSASDEKKSISQFLLEELGFPAVNLKKAPTKDSSDTARLSFLDIFKYMYLDQDDVGSTRMLDAGNHPIEVKNREVLKYIFNMLDTNVSDLDEEISAKSREKSALESEYKIISRFLSSTEFESRESIDSQIRSIEEETDDLTDQLTDINSRMKGDSELYEGFKEALNTINLRIAELESNKSEALINIERFGRLKNDYNKDVELLKSAEKAAQVIGREIEKTFECPICDSEVVLSELSEHFSIPSEDAVRHEVVSIARRSKDLAEIVSVNQKKLTEYDTELQDLYSEQQRAKDFIDEKLESAISPYLTERDAIVAELSYLKERREKFRHTLRVRNEQSQISDRVGRLEAAIVKLKEQLESLQKEVPSADAILEKLGKRLDSYLEKVHIKNRVEISIDPKTYFPVVRGTEYRNISSGGMRTIVSIGHLAVIMEDLLRADINHPGLLMIDTVGKFLGKNSGVTSEETDIDEDATEGMSDPEKYKNIYEYLLDLAESFENAGKRCQIILVDNDIPPQISSAHKGFEVAHYSTEGLDGLPIGLIDDWDQYLVDNSPIEPSDIE